MIGLRDRRGAVPATGGQMSLDQLRKSAESPGRGPVRSAVPAVAVARPAASDLVIHHERRLRRQLIEVSVVVVLDVVLSALAILLSRLLLPGIASNVGALKVLLAWPVALITCGGYASKVLRAPRLSVRPAIWASLGLLAVVSSASHLLGRPLGRLTLLPTLPALVLASLAVRAVVPRVLVILGLGYSSRRVLLVGPPREIQELSGRLSASHGDVVGAIVPKEQGHTPPFQRSYPLVLWGLERVTLAVQLTKADTVILSAGQLASEELRELIYALERLHIDLIIAPGLIGVDEHRLSVHVADGLPLLRVEAPRLPAAPLSKELFDRAAATLLLIMSGPLMAAVALLLKIFDPGPVIFRQERLGREGKPFYLYKFRTMRMIYSGRPPLKVFAEMGRLDLVEEFLEHQKVRADPRVSPIGRLLRSTSLDELPQLINVLRGDLSLVGPRPVVQEELKRFGDSARRILSCKPGITGLWQVAGRNDISYEDRVRHNLYYVDNWRLSWDVTLLIRTVRVLLERRGAC